MVEPRYYRIVVVDEPLKIAIERPLRWTKHIVNHPFCATDQREVTAQATILGTLQYMVRIPPACGRQAGPTAGGAINDGELGGGTRSIVRSQLK